MYIKRKMEADELNISGVLRMCFYFSSILDCGSELVYEWGDETGSERERTGSHWVITVNPQQ